MPADADAVELAGWLELPLDDAPALIVCGLNEGYVPSSVNADLFLPDALRSRLGLQDNLRRYARDAYALSVLTATRERLELIVARRNLDGDPLIPSRLLFASDLETIAERALRFFAPPSPCMSCRRWQACLTADRLEPDFPIPRPQPLEEPLRALRVTRCATIWPVPTGSISGTSWVCVRSMMRPRNWTAPRSGTCCMTSWPGSAKGRTGTRPIPARSARCSKNCSGSGSPRSSMAGLWPPSGVQIEHLRQRLGAFAEFQAGWAEQGWQIRYTEVPPRGSAGSTFHVGNDSILLHGPHRSHRRASGFGPGGGSGL
jgi:ATP-dependent helicase/nuclease subunit B